MSLLQSKTPTCTHIGLGSSAFARRYSQNRFFFLFLRLLRCFSSPGSLRLPIQLTPVQQTVHKVSLCGFPHSDICGSKCICHSPQLFAAYHVFHRLSVPRHPPCALFSLTNNLGRFAKQRIRRRLCLRVTAPFLSSFVFMLLMSSVTLTTFIALFFFVKK